MIIKSIHINAFGGITDRDIALGDGINVIGGNNEAGKTSAAMFLKFLFYGLSGKALKTEGASERVRFVNRERGEASGYAIATDAEGNEFRIERSLLVSDEKGARERVRIVNLQTGETVEKQNPGEYFFGVPESVFVGTAFVSQNKPVKPDVTKEGVSHGSVENLLTSADENIDIKRAVKRLDDVRRELCHKKGEGGEISSLREQRDACERERAESAERAQEILAATASMEDIKRRVDELREEQTAYSGVFAALAKIDVKRKFDTLEKTRRSAEDTAKSIAMIDSSPVGGTFEAELLSVERDVRAYEEQKKIYREKMPALTGDEPTETGDEYDGVVDFAISREKKMSAWFVASLVMLGVGLVALVVSLYSFLTGGLYLIPFGFFGLFVLLGIAGFLIRAFGKGSLKSLFREWGVGSTEELEDAIREHKTKIRNERALSERRRELMEMMDAAQSRYNGAVTLLSHLAKQVNLNGDGDVWKTIDALHAIADAAQNERNALVAKAENLKGKAELLEEDLRGVKKDELDAEIAELMQTEYGKVAAAMTPDEIKSATKEKEFTNGALLSAEKRKEALHERLNELGKLNRTPDELETMIHSYNERIAELTLRHEACEMAQSALLKAGEAMRADVIPRIGKTASLMMEAATGRYDRMTVDGSFACGLAEGDDVKTADFLSRGTEDLAYIALRIALADEVFRAEKPTVIFDESFAHVDSGRIESILSLLQKTGGQYLVFTCRAEETEIARRIGAKTVTL